MPKKQLAIVCNEHLWDTKDIFAQQFSRAEWDVKYYASLAQIPVEEKPDVLVVIGWEDSYAVEIDSAAEGSLPAKVIYLKAYSDDAVPKRDGIVVITHDFSSEHIWAIVHRRPRMYGVFMEPLHIKAGEDVACAMCGKEHLKAAWSDQVTSITPRTIDHENALEIFAKIFGWPGYATSGLFGTFRPEASTTVCSRMCAEKHKEEVVKRLKTP